MNDFFPKTKVLKVSKRKDGAGKWANLIAYLCLGLGSLVMIGPFLWAMSVSIQGPGMAYAHPPKLFAPPYQFKNYYTVLASDNIFRYAFNSLYITTFMIIGSLLSCSLIGFGMARYKFKGSELLFFIALSTMMIPSNILAIPLYIIFQKVGVLDTYIPLIIPSFFGQAMGIFLMRQCFKSISSQLYEAALIDGANPIKIFIRIYLPLARPMMATLAVKVFMDGWNSMFSPLIYITTQKKYTLTIGLLYLQGKYEHNLELLMAAAILTMIPTIIVYLFAQKHFVEGLASGSVKG